MDTVPIFKEVVCTTDDATTMERSRKLLDLIKNSSDPEVKMLLEDPSKMNTTFSQAVQMVHCEFSFSESLAKKNIFFVLKLLVFSTLLLKVAAIVLRRAGGPDYAGYTNYLTKCTEAIFISVISVIIIYRYDQTLRFIEVIGKDTIIKICCSLGLLIMVCYLFMKMSARTSVLASVLVALMLFYTLNSTKSYSPTCQTFMDTTYVNVLACWAIVKVMSGIPL